MTVPGVRVTSVRRTVVVAVTLVTGQALLCGLIGFLTFGTDGSGPAPRAAPQLAGPPIVVAPPTGLPLPGGLTDPPRSTTLRPDRTLRQMPSADGRGATPAATSSRSSTAAPAPSKPNAAPSTTPSDFALQPPPKPEESPGDAPTPVVGEQCDDEGASGRTADGTAVRCERDGDGELRWRPV